MKSIHFNICENGNEIELLEINQDELPKPDAFAVTVEIKACALNWISSEVFKELFLKNPQLSYPAGWDIAGVVVDTGASVSSLSNGDRVAGILPWDSGSSGCANFCVSSEFDLVKIADNVSFEVAAAAIGDGVKAYTALQHLGRLRHGDTVLLTDALSPWGVLTCQLCHIWGAKILALCQNDKEKGLLEDMNVDCVLETDGKGGIHVNSVLEETGGLGVDIIVDNGMRLFKTDEDRKLTGEDKSGAHLPHKHDLIGCLGIGARLVTSHPSLQLDPPDSQILHLKCASVGFLFPQAWTLASSHTGRFQHILQDIVKRLANGDLNPTITRMVTLSEVKDILSTIKEETRGKTVMKN